MTIVYFSIKGWDLESQVAMFFMSEMSGKRCNKTWKVASRNEKYVFFLKNTHCLPSQILPLLVTLVDIQIISNTIQNKQLNKNLTQKSILQIMDMLYFVYKGAAEEPKYPKTLDKFWKIHRDWSFHFEKIGNSLMYYWQIPIDTFSLPLPPHPLVSIHDEHQSLFIS